MDESDGKVVKEEPALESMENSNVEEDTTRLPQDQVKPIDEGEGTLMKKEPALESMEDSNDKTEDITQDLIRPGGAELSSGTRPDTSGDGKEDSKDLSSAHTAEDVLKYSNDTKDCIMELPNKAEGNAQSHLMQSPADDDRREETEAVPLKQVWFDLCYFTKPMLVVLERTHPGVELSLEPNSVNLMRVFAQYFTDKFATVTAEIAKSKKKTAIQAIDMHEAVASVLPEKLMERVMAAQEESLRSGFIENLFEIEGVQPVPHQPALGSASGGDDNIEFAVNALDVQNLNIQIADSFLLDDVTLQMTVAVMCLVMEKINSEVRRYCEKNNRPMIGAREMHQVCESLIPPKLFERASRNAKNALLNTPDCDTDWFVLSSNEPNPSPRNAQVHRNV